MNKGIIFNIQKFCLHDGDGIRTCVFLKGCPLRCIWCHNPESLDKSPELSFSGAKCTCCGRCLEFCSARKISGGKLHFERSECSSCGRCTEVCLNGANGIIGKETTASEVIAEVIKDKPFYDKSGGGLTVTGGEPSYQAGFSLELIRLAKESGISSAVETCGIGSREFYEKAADLGASFLYDIKCLDSERHKELTGADNTRILANLRYLFERNADVIIRLPMIPECNDSDSDIAALSAFLNDNKAHFRYAEIMPYHSLGIGKNEKIGACAAFVHGDATEDDISRWCSLFASHGAEVKVSR